RRAIYSPSPPAGVGPPLVIGGTPGSGVVPTPGVVPPLKMEPMADETPGSAVVHGLPMPCATPCACDDSPPKIPAALFRLFDRWPTAAFNAAVMLSPKSSFASAPEFGTPPTCC